MLDPRQMYVVIERKRMDVACYAQGKLLFVNSYPIDQSDDIVYYILYVWKQAGLDQEKDQLLLAGESSSRNAGSGAIASLFTPC